MKVPILMYHRVAESRSDQRFTVSPRRFAQHMRALLDAGYTTVGLSAIADAVEGKNQLTEKSIAITFDDGFLETYENVMGTLEDLGFSATFFLVSGLMGRSTEWIRSDGESLPQLMSWDQARHLLRAGFSIGSHTRTHVDLTTLDGNRMGAEIGDSKREIEDRLGVTVDFFAYPFGLVNAPAVEAVQWAGFYGACSTQSGFNSSSTDRYRLRRIEVRGTDSTAILLRSVIFGENSMSSARLFRYYARRAVSRLVRA